MDPTEKPERVTRLVQRESAERYLLLTLLSFAASVSLTRLFLSLSNYPQIGNGDLHIAHVLWGGLLLYTAAILPLLFANRRVYTISALLAGSGVGLFIDEVGKFITQKNDYFAPVAASIVYVLFLLTIALLVHIRRLGRTQARDELTNVFENIREALHHPITSREYLRLKTSLEGVVNSAPTRRYADLAEALLKFLEPDATRSHNPPNKLGISIGLAKRKIARLFSDRYLRIYLMLGLLAIGLLNLKNPLSILLARWLPPNLSALLGMYAGRHVEAATSPLWSSIRLILEVGVGVLLLTAAGLLAVKRNKQGAAMGYVALLLSLTTVDILLFYFEQFSTIITTAIQFLLLIGIVVYQRRTD
jgi:hypothetical protein